MGSMLFGSRRALNLSAAVLAVLSILGSGKLPTFTSFQHGAIRHASQSSSLSMATVRAHEHHHNLEEIDFGEPFDVIIWMHVSILPLCQLQV